MRGPTFGLLILAIILLLVAHSLGAQDYLTARTFGPDSMEFRTANAIIVKLEQSNQLPHFQWMIIHNWNEGEQVGRPVWLLAGVIRALQNDPGKLAFVIAREIGSLERGDRERQTEERGGKPVICTDNPLQTFATLGDPSRYIVRSKTECQLEGDRIAIAYMAAAGYSPFDASAFLGNTTYGPYINNAPQWVRDYVAGRPSTKQLTDTLRQYVIAFCTKDAKACHMQVR